MRYIIMCGGKYDKWSKSRQLAKIFGEPVVARTIRLLREAGISDIAISTNDSRFESFGVHILRLSNPFTTSGGGSWVDGFYPTEDPTCYLMGDVVFSPEAIRTIVETETDGIQFFASSPPFSECYTKPWAEPFAFKVLDLPRFWSAVEFTRGNEKTGVFLRRPIAWELWQVINGEDTHDINFRNYVAINDYTCDLDEPEDVQKIERAICHQNAL